MASTFRTSQHLAACSSRAVWPGADWRRQEGLANPPLPHTPPPTCSAAPSLSRACFSLGPLSSALQHSLEALGKHAGKDEITLQKPTRLFDSIRFNERELSGNLFGLEAVAAWSGQIPHLALRARAEGVAAGAGRSDSHLPATQQALP